MYPSGVSMRSAYTLEDRGSYSGVANIGIRPTVGGERVLLEANLFEFAEEIYGCHIRVEFMTKIRPERRFESFEALKEQIARDSTAAQQWFEGQRG